MWSTCLLARLRIVRKGDTAGEFHWMLLEFAAVERPLIGLKDAYGFNAKRLLKRLSLLGKVFGAFSSRRATLVDKSHSILQQLSKLENIVFETRFLFHLLAVRWLLAMSHYRLRHSNCLNSSVRGLCSTLTKPLTESYSNHWSPMLLLNFRWVLTEYLTGRFHGDLLMIFAFS